MIPLAGSQLMNLHRLMPEVVLSIFGIIVMIADPFVGAARKRVLGWVALIGALLALASVHIANHFQGAAYSDLIRVDSFSMFVHVIVLVAVVLAILGSFDYLDQENIQRGEYYALVLFAAVGMGILAGANELVTAFVGLEISSIASYVLVGFRRRSPASNEASLKYFLLGSFATAFFLYGIAMVYGATGTTRIDSVQTALGSLLAADARIPGLAILGLGLIFVGLGFKVVVSPFQVYAPDVYEGAPTPVTALLASAPKAATFALMIRIFYVSFASAQGYWFWAHLRLRGADDVHRQFRGDRADQREAHARVLFDRARRLYSRRVCRLERAGRCGGFVLSRGVHLHEGRRVPHRHAPRPAG